MESVYIKFTVIDVILFSDYKCVFLTPTTSLSCLDF